ncbi:tetraspanin Tsp3, variant 2 [Blastomyces gilchristii SLH14081]|uniref:Tetraspanin Tsp3 n=4 Tax=Blastomyces TaxID=229219 RepID=A0A179UAX3_BLAGS|nr:tetraspanin Tsp3 [Blastomyces gilchristii SLH14081]XP_031576406.1 tetraspanin Tsp3, variant 1 [Blastomyces gilchristii SLH14081]XP_031576407.1 tetraspanin Tsp3, variant 2 [Blastomyces gilchristii SLH14081]OAT04861.1 tetraspanin Tsp3 [Blastomyces gilchristii SLH14081]OAT04862.1 tetraspanin Tsp3, variant 1 [Blastomyces gilchristii SLH14081]OAT04863.1 tetraspanin Tsp3, variant 2 [Blastomyces gilchristii SLH14081]
MTLSSTAILVVSGCLTGLVATILSAYAWFRTSKYYLPLPIPLSGITTFLPIATAILIPLFTNLATRSRNQRSGTALLGHIDIGRFMVIVEQLLTIIPTALATFTISYFVSEDIVGCRLENQWQSYYSRKNANAIRSIQDRLQCCGFRSTRDRGWPFPGGSDQRDCTSTFGYTRSCFAEWRSTQREAATMIFTAAVLSLAMKFILSSRQYGLSTRHTRLPYHETNEGTENGNGTHANSTPRRLITDARYHDEPDEEERHRVDSPTAPQSPNVNAFGIANGQGDARNNIGDNYNTGSSGALHISNLRL